MNSIGGYFELELKNGEHYHKNALPLNTARNCLEYIIKSRKYSKVYIPFYTCDVVLEPLNKCGIQYEFYHINEKLEPTNEIELNADEAFLYTNYFGLKQHCVERLAQIYKQLIIDNAQAFFAKPLPGVDTFYSVRKFFGVPDGAYLYTDKYLEESLIQDYSFDRMDHLLKRIDISAEEGYRDFQLNEKSLINSPIRKMSNITGAIASSIDYDKAKTIRRNNYLFLHKHLKESNKIQFNIDINGFVDIVPMVYPYFIDNGEQIKNELINNKIFIPTYWPNVMEWIDKESIEYKFSNNILPLPIDQRYNIDDMNRILKEIIWKK